MMKFTLGLAIFAFTAIVGSYKYIENSDLLEARVRGLKEVSARRDETGRMKERLKVVKKISMPQGEDQKFTIERKLGIGAPGMDFNFVGQGRNNTAQPVFRHSFRIQGPADFTGILRLLRTLASQPGFAVNSICYACVDARSDLPEGQRIVTIEGYLYVFDPNLVK